MSAPLYCVADNVRAAAAPRALSQSDDELDAVILLAQKDVDRKLPDLPRGTGEAAPKLLPTELDPYTAAALADATAAQVLYRLHMGASFFVESYQAVGGKDFSSAKAPPKFSTFARDILLECGLMAMSGRMWGGRYGGIRTIDQERWSW